MKKKARSRKPVGRRPTTSASSSARVSAKGQSEEELWAGLRQGARNVAGVRYQIAVTADLLVEASAGMNDFVTFVPEGFEDLDLVRGDSRRCHAQAKDLGAGSGRLTAAAVAEIVEHAAAAANGADIAIVTDAPLGSGLRYTGWEQKMPELHEQSILSVLAGHLQARGVDPDLLERTHLIRIPWQAAPRTIRTLSERRGLTPAVAGLVYARLLVDLTTIAADQRARSATDPLRRRPGDVDAIIRSVLDTVDLKALDAAIVDGVCEPVDFCFPSDLTAGQFLAGVDVAPAHIAASLDVPRERELTEIYQSLETHGYVLIMGPSGSGKSALLWRAARDWVRASRVVRVRRLGTREDVESLVRWVRLQEPSEVAPLLVCIDDLGRHVSSAWPEAVDLLLEMPHVRLLGAVRSEDFRPSLVRARAMIVTPQLDEGLARTVADGLVASGVELRRDPAEAFPEAHGLLMEYVALVSSGRRMEGTLAEQVDAIPRTARDRRNVLRLVCAAHGLGAPLASAALRRLTGNPALGEELTVLKDEHLVVLDEDGNWTGLHELRSETITHLLHDCPPPTRADTYAELLPAVDEGAQGDAVARAAEQCEGDLRSVAEGIASLILTITDARHLTPLLLGLSKADAFAHLRSCIPVLRRHETATLDAESLATIVYTTRFAGVELPSPMGDRLREIAAELPDYPVSLRKRALQGLTEAHLLELVSSTSPPDAVDLLEAIEGGLQISRGCANAIWSDLRSRCSSVRSIARAPASLAALAAIRTAGAAEATFGDLRERLEAVVAESPYGLGVRLDEAEDGLVVSADIMASSDATPNDQAVVLCRALLGIAPEAAIAEVVMRSPDGGRYMYAGLELGYKRIPRSNLPRDADVRATVHFFEALHRSRGAESWTKRLREQALVFQAARRAVQEIPARVLPTSDNARRRREWGLAVAQVQVGAAHLSGLPNPELRAVTRSVSDEPRSDAKSDPAKAALDRLAQALGILADHLADGRPSRPGAIGHQLREVVPLVRAAREMGVPSLASVGETTLPSDLEELLDLAASVLLILDRLPPVIRRDPGERWLDVGRRLVQTEWTRQMDEERGVLDAWMSASGVDYEVVVLPGESYSANSLALNQWLILVSPDQLAGVPPVEALPEGDRERLAFRLVVAPVDSGKLLPVGQRLGATQWFPLVEQGDFEPLAEAAGLTVVDGSPLREVKSCISRVLELSFEVARRSWRDPALPEPLDFAPRNLSIELAALEDELREVEPKDLREVVGALFELARDEVSSGTPVLAVAPALMMRSGETNELMSLLDLLVIEAGRTTAIAAQNESKTSAAP